MNLIPSSFFDTDNFFNDWWGRKNLAKSDTPMSFSPRVDIREKKDKYIITADLPGVDKDDIKVSLHNGVLALEAKTEDESTEEKEGEVIRRERYYGSYLRRFDLGSNLQESDIHAKFKNGVLELTAPKLEEKEPEVKMIDIR